MAGREADEDQRQMAIAARTIQAESNRLWFLANRLQDLSPADFEAQARYGLLQPSEIRIHNQSTIAQMLAMLGDVSAALGMPAIPKADEAARNAAEYVALVNSGRNQGAVPWSEMSKLARQITAEVREAAAMLFDAYNQHPISENDVPKSTSFRAALLSQHGQDLEFMASVIEGTTASLLDLTSEATIERDPDAQL